MSRRETAKALAAITDSGLFEDLATAVLRFANPLYAGLVHTGINLDGKTRKAPVDGVSFVTGASPPHMIVVHHTTGAEDGLLKKWLFDPATVKRRPHTKTPLPPAGDLIKAVEEVRKARERAPETRATLVLTATEEPVEELVIRAALEAKAADMELDIWSRERIAGYLDIDPDGQWIRRKYLGAPVNRLSQPLLQDLSQASLARLEAAEDGRTWVSRRADHELARLSGPVVFISAPSGHGKTVLGRRRLVAHRDAGGIALVMQHAVLEQATTLAEAIDLTLRDLEPSLGAGQAATAFCTPEHPLLLLVEDLNRAQDSAGLIAKILSWAPNSESEPPAWRVLCPVWPTTWATLDHKSQEAGAPMLFSPTPMSREECEQAVRRRAEDAGRPITSQAAADVAERLGYDPLLIGIYDFETAPQPGRVILEFVERALVRAATGTQAWRLKSALSDLGKAMLSRRVLEPQWPDVDGWNLSQQTLEGLERIAETGEILRRPLSTSNPRIEFRHDRVRDRVLVQALLDLDNGRGPDDSLLEDPFFAELLAQLVADKPALVERLERLNPLALAFGLKMSDPSSTHRSRLLESLDRWLTANSSDARAVTALRWRIGALLASTADPAVAPLGRHWSKDWMGSQIALRAGDLLSAARLLSEFPPGVGFHDATIEEASATFGSQWTPLLTVALPHPANRAAKIPLLRLAGFLGEPRLQGAITSAWAEDTGPNRRGAVRDYFWAAARCLGPGDPTVLLEAICEVWAEVLQETREIDGPLMAALALPQALEAYPPHAALAFLRERAAKPDIHQPLLDILERIDDPDTLEFVVTQRADHSPPFNTAWERRVRDGSSGMSEASRTRLLELWATPDRPENQRRTALRLWGLTRGEKDLAALEQISQGDELSPLILDLRLARGDATAIDTLVDRLDRDVTGHDWARTRHTSDRRLQAAVKRALERLETKPTPDDYLLDQIQATLMRMPASWAEAALLGRPKVVQAHPQLFQALLFVATPSALELAARIVEAHGAPKVLCAYIGVKMMGVMADHPGITRREQIVGLLPFRTLIDCRNLKLLAMTCNGRGWFDLRDQLVKGEPDDPQVRFVPSALTVELDRAVNAIRSYGLRDIVEMHLRTGADWASIRQVLLDWWSGCRSDPVAFAVVTEIFTEFAPRTDIPSLVAAAASSSDLQAEAQNAAFEIRRRSLH